MTGMNGGGVRSSHAVLVICVEIRSKAMVLNGLGVSGGRW